MSDSKKSFDSCKNSGADIAINKPALSLLSRSTPVNKSTCRVAILVGEGVDEASVKTVFGELFSHGASPRIIGCNSGRVNTFINTRLVIETFLGAGHSMLYDAIVVMCGKAFVQQLPAHAYIFNFLQQQYTYCRPILAIGHAISLLKKSNISLTLPSGLADPAILTEAGHQLKKSVALFKNILPIHKFFSIENSSQIV